VQTSARDAPQLVVDERHQRLESGLVSLAPGSEERRHLVGRGQNRCILTGFARCPFSVVPFRLYGREASTLGFDEIRFPLADHECGHELLRVADGGP
jgi:hypothetical protein